MAPQGCLDERYTPGVHTTVPVLILIIGVAVVIGRSRPILTVAVLFAVIGGYAVMGGYGSEVADGLGYLLRPIT